MENEIFLYDISFFFYVAWKASNKIAMILLNEWQKASQIDSVSRTKR